MSLGAYDDVQLNRLVKFKIVDRTFTSGGKDLYRLSRDFMKFTQDAVTDLGTLNQNEYEERLDSVVGATVGIGPKGESITLCAYVMLMYPPAQAEGISRESEDVLAMAQIVEAMYTLDEENWKRLIAGKVWKLKS